MNPITASTWIAAPQSEVFACASDLANAGRWLTGVKNIEMLTTGPMAVGTKWRETRVLGGRESTEEMTVSAFHPPRSYTVKCDSHGANFTSVLMCEPDRGGTIVSMDMQIRPVSFVAKLMSPLMRMMAGKLRKCLSQDLADLKRAAEAANVASVR